MTTSTPKKLTKEERLITDEIAFHNGADDLGDAYARFRDGDWKAVSPLTMIDWADLLDVFVSTPVNIDIDPSLSEKQKEVASSQITRDLLCRVSAATASDKLRDAAVLFPYDAQNPDARVDRTGNPV